MSVHNITEPAQYLAFNLREEQFAVNVAVVREILDVTTITRIPQTPDYMCGVINLRGSVVPVIDLHLKFGMPPTQQTVNTCIIVVELEHAGEILVLGALADSVQEVIDMEPEQIEPAPNIGISINTDFIRGMGKRGDHFLMILDINKLFASSDLSALQERAEAA